MALMIYGANGYTGQLVSEQAKGMGLDFVVAGRSPHSVQSAAITLGVPYRAFDLADADIIDANIAGVRVLLNCAGPFSQTAERLIDACIRNGVHYLDASAELVSYLSAEKRDDEAEAAGVMLLPGCGGSTAMLGCLASRVLESAGSVENVAAVDIALHVSGSMSRGSLTTAGQGTADCMKRSNGALTKNDTPHTEKFDFANGQGPVDCFPVTLPDLVTIHKFFGVRNIRTFAHASGTAFANPDPNESSAGPSFKERDASPYDAAVTVTMIDGSLHHATLHSINGYSFIAVVSAEAARRVLAGKSTSGFQMSATLFGSEFVDSVAGTVVSTTKLAMA